MHEHRKHDNENLPHPFAVKLRAHDFSLRQAYTDQLEVAGFIDPDYTDENMPLEISLWDIPDKEKKRRRAQLSKKLQEYEQRLSQEWAKAKGKIIDLPEKGNKYRRDVLAILLRDESVHTLALQKAYPALAQVSPFDPLSFSEAVRVVHNYVHNEGKDLIDGTGLPEVP